MTYRLIALDLDGTLMTENARVAPRVKAAITMAQDRGTIVTLASGRAFGSMRPYAEELGIAAPLICYQGCKIVVPESGQVIYHTPMPLDHTRRLLAYTQSHGIEATVYIDDHIYLSDIRHPQEFYDRWFGLPMTVVEDLATGIQNEPTKILMIGEPKDNDRNEPILQKEFGSSLWIVRSHPLFVEAMALGVSKGVALEKVAEYLGISQEETMAIGDSDNDLEMVKWAGLGVAMGNAVPPVKAVADYVAPPVEEDGVAVALKKYILSV